jgi:hypothetical protein
MSGIEIEWSSFIWGFAAGGWLVNFIWWLVVNFIWWSS